MNEMWEYRFKVSSQKGDNIKELAAELGITIKDLMLGGIELMRQRGHADFERNVAIAVVQELKAIGFLDRPIGGNKEKPVDLISSSFFE